MTDLISIKSKIDDINKQIETLEEKNKSAKSIDIIRVNLNKLEIARLEEKKSSALKDLAKKINESGEKEIISDPSTAYKDAAKMIDQSKIKINNISAEIVEVQSWLSNEKEIFQKSLSNFIENKKNSIEKDALDHFNETKSSIELLSKKMKDLGERDKLIAKTEEQISSFSSYQFSPSTEAGRNFNEAFKAINEVLDSMKNDHISAVTVKTTQELKDKVEPQMKIIEESIKTVKTILQSDLQSWNEKRATVINAYVDMPMLGTTREEIRKMHDEMNRQADGKASEINKLVKEGKYAEASTLIQEAVRSLRDFESRVSETIRISANTPEDKKEVETQAAAMEQAHKEIDEITQKAEERRNERINREREEQDAQKKELNDNTKKFIKLLINNHPGLANQLPKEAEWNDKYLNNFRRALEHKNSIKLLSSGHRLFGTAALHQKFTVPYYVLENGDPNKKITVNLTPVEKALLGVIFSPKEDQAARQKRFNKLSQETPAQGPSRKGPGIAGG